MARTYYDEVRSVLAHLTPKECRLVYRRVGLYERLCRTATLTESQRENYTIVAWELHESLGDAAPQSADDCVIFEQAVFDDADARRTRQETANRVKATLAALR